MQEGDVCREFWFFGGVRSRPLYFWMLQRMTWPWVSTTLVKMLHYVIFTVASTSTTSNKACFIRLMSFCGKVRISQCCRDILKRKFTFLRALKCLSQAGRFLKRCLQQKKMIWARTTCGRTWMVFRNDLSLSVLFENSTVVVDSWRHHSIFQNAITLLPS